MIEKYSIESLRKVKETREKLVEEEIRRKAEKIQRENQRKKILQETKAKERKRRTTFIAVGSVFAIIFLIIGLRIKDKNFKETYGLTEAEHIQWENALQEYSEWSSAIIGAENDFSSYCDSNKAENYSYYEILENADLKVERNKVLDLYDNIDKIVFPDKYMNIFNRIKEYQQLYYIMEIDFQQLSHFLDDFPSELLDQQIAINDEIEKLETYLNEEYLIPENISLETNVVTSYTPKTLSYTFSTGNSFTKDIPSENDISKAKDVADKYCRMLENKHTLLINYVGIEDASTSWVKFEYEVLPFPFLRAELRYGIVTVVNGSSGWEVLGMEYEEE